VFRVSGGVNEKVVNVHNYIGESMDNSFHQALEAGRAAKQAHGAGDHWNWPMPGTVNAVYGWARGCRIICQKPALRLMVWKIVLPEQLILPMHSLTSFIEYLSV
jgi:hypothetical protein